MKMNSVVAAALAVSASFAGLSVFAEEGPWADLFARDFSNCEVEAGARDFGYGEWACPSVMEQYRCYVPIDASAAKLVNTYMALYRAERNPLDLAKAQALAATAIRVQEPGGRIATFWTAGGFRDPNGDWINCMAAIARALENLE